MPTRDPSPLSQLIEQQVYFFRDRAHLRPGKTFLQGIRKDLADPRYGGWDAPGDIPAIVAYSCSIGDCVRWADVSSTTPPHLYFPQGFKSVFSDWSRAQSHRKTSNVEKMAVLCCIRALLAVDMVEQGDNTWKIAQRICESMDTDQRIEAMKGLFQLANTYPGGEDQPRLARTSGLLVMGQHRPEDHGQTPEDGWRTLLACIEDVKDARRHFAARQLPMSLGAPGPNFYRDLPVDARSARLVLDMARGLLRQDLPDPVRNFQIAQSMLTSLHEWVNQNHVGDGIGGEDLAKSWSKVASIPLFAPLEPVAMSIIMACNAPAAPHPTRAPPRL